MCILDATKFFAALCTAATGKDGRALEECRPVQKVEWYSAREKSAIAGGAPPAAGEHHLTVFSGGMPFDRMSGRMPCLTIQYGRSTTVLEMDHNIVDFVTLVESPFSNGACFPPLPSPSPSPSPSTPAF